MEKTEEKVHQVKSKPKSQSRQHKQSTCEYCGESHQRGKCPAYGHECLKCHKQNHFAKVCQSAGPDKSGKPKAWPKKNAKQKVHQVAADADDLSSDESIYNIHTVSKGTQYFVNLQTRPRSGGTPAVLKFQIDTGATCSTLRLQDYQRVTTEPLQPSTAKLRLYDKSVIKPTGATTLRCKTDNGTTKLIHFEVVDKAPTSLLSGRASEALELLQFSQEHVVHTVRKEPTLTKDYILQEYKDIFTGLCKLPGHYHIELDEMVKPVQNTRRRVPIPIREELKAKLQSLEQEKIIRKVEEPTSWISSMVVVKKPNKLRICLDPQNLNKGIKRNHYPIPTIEKVAPRLAKAKVFSVVDAKDGFLQVVLDEESSYLTTFWTPHGRYRWLRMPFGISSAPEEFQRRLDVALEGLDNVEVIADDIIIYGTGDTEEEAEASHDTAFIALLNRSRERGLKLNAKKIKFKMPSVAYMGHVISAQGLAPDPDKVRAVQEMPKPTDVQGVQRLLGVVTYLAKFMPRLSAVCEPLRRLTDKDVMFDWMPQHDKALDTIKQLTTHAPVLQFYDIKKEVSIECDSSDVGLGAVLTQEGKPIAYASRSLTSSERHYAQIEKECPAIVFAAERFDQYILGRSNERIQTDHKPPMPIFTKPILTNPKRLQRMRLRLQKYSLNVEYKPGPEMYISDTLSRASLPQREVTSDTPPYVIFQVAEECHFQEELAEINMEADVFVSDERLQRIQEETLRDTTFQTLANMVITGWPSNKQEVPLCIREYWPYRDELATQNGIIFRGTRVVIPTNMRRDLIVRAHASHLGIQSSINKAREIMFWPHMSQELTEAIQKCPTCQKAQPANCKEPLMTHPLPTVPWQVVATDCFELDGQSYCVFIEVVELEDMTTETLVKKTKPVFATHGIPATLISDNGPNLASREFRQFAREWDFRHITTSPHHSRANGKAESAVKIAKGLIRRSKRDGGDMWQSILEWRNTPTPRMDSSPVQRLMSPRSRTLMPCNNTLYKPEIQEAVPDQIARKRQQAKKFYDRTAKPLPQLVVGQTVRVKTRPQVDHAPWKPGVIKDKVAPRSYIVEVDGRRYRRNRVHLRDTLVTHDTRKPSDSEALIMDIAPTTPDPMAKSLDSHSEPQVVTRSGRISKRPQYLKDYVT
ncbi:uncharacterized protein K02A2.6-like [Patiria miniata]|uniref:Endonuclease n=1 Tax=Patiria miniata TaxID=46514 RepID=A0A914AA18_PATMI|nr:uncharacterized protein K02A2.6-like [Patiria miniata]